MGKESRQKFIGRNRTPRVQIEYELSTTGEKMPKIPFVVGVLADLFGTPAEGNEPKDLDERGFVDFDADTFNSKMQKMKPRVVLAVPNLLTNDGDLKVDITFESMSDWTPDAIARKVAPLKRILDRRTELEQFKAFLTGKAEKELSKALSDPVVRSALGETGDSDGDGAGDDGGDS